MAKKSATKKHDTNNRRYRDIVYEVKDQVACRMRNKRELETYLDGCAKDLNAPPSMRRKQ